MRRPGYELDRLLFRVKKDSKFRSEFLRTMEKVLDMYRLTEEERRAIGDRDYSKLSRLGAKPELVIALAMASDSHPK